MKRSKTFPDKALEQKAGKELSKRRLNILNAQLLVFKNNIEMLYQLRYDAIVFTHGTDFYIEKFQTLIEKIEKAILKVM